MLDVECGKGQLQENLRRAMFCEPELHCRRISIASDCVDFTKVSEKGSLPL